MKLQFSAVNLPSSLLDKSDPFIKVSRVVPSDEAASDPNFTPARGESIYRNYSLEKIFTSEIIKNNTEPAWITVMAYEYAFERDEWLLLEIYDADSPSDVSADLPDKDLLGYVFVKSSTLITRAANGTALSLKLYDRRNSLIQLRDGVFSTLQILATVGGATAVEFAVVVDFKKASRFINYKLVFNLNDSTGKNLHTEQRIAKDDMSFKFAVNPVLINDALAQGPLEMAASMNSDKTIQPVNIQAVYDDDADDTTRDTAGAKGDAESKMPPVGYTGKGEFSRDKYSLSYTINSGNRCTFARLVSKGRLDIGCMFAVDFTGSNGNPLNEGSLHAKRGRNMYRDAIRSIATTLDAYDSDGKYPLYGFGLHDGTSTRHDLMISDSADSTEIVAAYNAVIDKVCANRYALSGPTYYLPSIRAMVEQATRADAEHRTAGSRKLSYNVLVVFTDGSSNETEEQLYSCVKSLEDLPLSVVFVAVGDMNPELLQFVAERHYTRPCMNVVRTCHVSLAEVKERIMRDIPTHIEQYFAKHN
jgi:hypothetical protein